MKTLGAGNFVYSAFRKKPAFRKKRVAPLSAVFFLSGINSYFVNLNKFYLLVAFLFIKSSLHASFLIAAESQLGIKQFALPIPAGCTVDKVIVSPDGIKFVTLYRRHCRPATLWSSSWGHHYRNRQYVGYGGFYVFSPDSRLLFVADHSSLFVYDVAACPNSGKQRETEHYNCGDLRTEKKIFAWLFVRRMFIDSIAISEDGDRLATGTNEGYVDIFNVSELLGSRDKFITPLVTFKHAGKGHNHVTFNKGGELVMSSRHLYLGDPSTVKVWSLEGELLHDRDDGPAWLKLPDLIAMLYRWAVTKWSTNHGLVCDLRFDEIVDQTMFIPDNHKIIINGIYQDYVCDFTQGGADVEHDCKVLPSAGRMFEEPFILSPSGDLVLFFPKSSGFFLGVWDKQVLTASEQDVSAHLLSKLSHHDTIKHDGNMTLEEEQEMAKCTISTAIFTPDEKFIITAARNGSVRYWDVEALKALGSGQIAEPADTLEISGSVRMIYAGAAGSVIKIFSDTGVVTTWYPQKYN